MIDQEMLAQANGDGRASSVPRTRRSSPAITTDTELPARAGSDDRASELANSILKPPVVAPMSARADGDGRADVLARTLGTAPAITTNPTQPGNDGPPAVAGERRGNGRATAVAISGDAPPAIATPAIDHEMLAEASGDGSAIYVADTIPSTPAIPTKSRKRAIVTTKPSDGLPLPAEGGAATWLPTTGDLPPAALDFSDTIAAIRALGRQRRFLIKSINRSGNSVGAYARTLLGWRLDLPEAEREKIAKRAAKMVAAIRKGVESDEPMAATIAPVVMANDAGQAPLTKLRDHTESEMKKLARTFPVYPFAKNVKGFGDLALAVIIAEAGDVGSYKSRSALWKRLGLAVIDGERQSRRTNVEDAARHGYSPHRRAEMYAVVADPLFKHQWRGADEETGEVAHAVGPYGERYGAKKAEYMARVEATADLPYSDKAKWTPKRADSAARRYMTKCLLRDLFGAWKAAHRLPDTEPYQMAA